MRLRLTCLFMMVCHLVMAQRQTKDADCRRMLAEARASAAGGHYAAAINKLAAVGTRCPDSAAAVSGELVRIYTDINSAKENEKNARKRAITAKDEAIQAAKIAEARRLAAESQNNLILYPASVEASAAAAVRSMELYPSPEGDRALRALLQVAAPLKKAIPFKLNPDYVAISGLMAAAGGFCTETLEDELFVYDAKTDRQMIKKDFGKFSISAVRFSPDGQYLAVIAYDMVQQKCRIEVMRGINLAPVFRTERTAYFGSVAFSPDSRFLAFAESAGQVVIYDLPDGSITRPSIPMILSGGSNRSLAFSPSGNYLLIEQASAVTIWSDWLSGTLKKVFSQTSTSISGFQYDFDSTGNRVALAINDTIRLTDLSSGSTGTGFAIKQLKALAFNAQNQLLTFDGNGILGIRDPLALASPTNVYMGPVDLPDKKIMLANQGAYLVTSRRDDGKVFNAASLQEVNSGKEVTRMYHSQYIRSVGPAARGSSAITVGSDDQVRIWGAIDEGQRVYPSAEAISCFSLSEDQQVLALATRSRLMRTREIHISTQGKRDVELAASADISQMRLSADARDLAVLTRTGIEYWHGWQGKGRTLERHDLPLLHEPTALGSFDKIGRIVIVCDGKGHLSVLNAADATLIKTISYYNPTGVNSAGNVSTICVSPSGKYAGLVLDDGVALISLAEGRQLKFIPEAVRLSNLVFSPDERQFMFVAYNIPVQGYLNPYPSLVRTDTESPALDVIDLPDTYNGDITVDDAGKLIAFTFGKLIRIYRLPKKGDKALELLSEIQREATVKKCAFSADSRWLVSCYGQTRDELLFSLVQPDDLVRAVKRRFPTLWPLGTAP